MKRIGLLALLALLTAIALAPQADAQDDKLIKDPDIVVEVGGLSCPFCAYGIEKRLKGIEGVEEVSVLLEEGKVQLKMEEGVTVSEERIKKAVSDAGFEARSVVFVNEEAKAPSVG